MRDESDNPSTQMSGQDDTFHLAAAYRRISKSVVKSMVNFSNYAFVFGIRLQ